MSIDILKQFYKIIKNWWFRWKYQSTMIAYKAIIFRILNYKTIKINYLQKKMITKIITI